MWRLVDRGSRYYLSKLSDEGKQLTRIGHGYRALLRDKLLVNDHLLRGAQNATPSFEGELTRLTT